MRNGQFIRVGKNESRNSLFAQRGMQFNHRLDWLKNVPENISEFLHVPAIPGGFADFLVKLFLGHQTRFVAEEQGGMINKLLNFRSADMAVGSDFTGHNPVVEINQY